MILGKLDVLVIFQSIQIETTHSIPISVPVHGKVPVEMENLKSSCLTELIDEILLGACQSNPEEVTCWCRDGQVGFSRFYLGLLSPVIFRILNDDVYSAINQVTLLLPDFSVRELEQLRSLPLEGCRTDLATRSLPPVHRPSQELLQTLAIAERFRRTKDKASPRPSPHVSPLCRKMAAVSSSTAAKPLSNCCDYLPDIYSLELFEPDYYLDSVDIQEEENLSLTIHSSKPKQNGGAHAAKVSAKRARSKATAGQAKEIKRGKLVLKIPKQGQQSSKQDVIGSKNIMDIQCDHCRKVFVTETALKAHGPLCQLSATAVVGSRKFVCTTCDKSFKKSFQLENHHRIHSGDRPFVCHTCGKAFNQEATLRTHMRIHSGSKPHACKECGESFVTAFALVSHLQWRHNEGIRPFLCSFCSKAFPTKQALSKHETIHRTDRKYSCAHCDKKFARPDHLKSHMRTHPNEALSEGDSAPL